MDRLGQPSLDWRRPRKTLPPRSHLFPDHGDTIEPSFGCRELEDHSRPACPRRRGFPVEIPGCKVVNRGGTPDLCCCRCHLTLGFREWVKAIRDAVAQAARGADLLNTQGSRRSLEKVLLTWPWCWSSPESCSGSEDALGLVRAPLSSWQPVRLVSHLRTLSFHVYRETRFLSVFLQCFPLGRTRACSS